MLAAFLASPFFFFSLFCVLIGIFGNATTNGVRAYGAEVLRSRLIVCSVGLVLFGVGAAIVALLG